MPRRNTSQRAHPARRRRARHRVRNPGGGVEFNIMPTEVLDLILKRLRLCDLHNLCLSGVLPPSTPAATQARQLFRARVADLEHVVSLMDHLHVYMTFAHQLPSGWGVSPPVVQLPNSSENLRAPVALSKFIYRQSSLPDGSVPRAPPGQFPLSPVEVVRRVDRLALSDVTERAAQTIVREFPHVDRGMFLNHEFPDRRSAVEAAWPHVSKLLLEKVAACSAPGRLVFFGHNDVWQRTPEALQQMLRKGGPVPAQ